MSTERNYWFEHDGFCLCVNVTHEGVIMDVYRDPPPLEPGVEAFPTDEEEGEPVATVGMTSDEWIEWVIDRDS